MRRNPATRDDLIKTLQVAADAAEEIGQVELAERLRLAALAVQKCVNHQPHIFLQAICTRCGEEGGHNEPLFAKQCKCGEWWPVCARCDEGVRKFARCPSCSNRGFARRRGPRRRAVEHGDFDEHYVGDGHDGASWQIGRSAFNDDRFYVRVWVDSETGNFTDDLITDDGPYNTAEEASRAGRFAAVEWCLTNNVQFEDDDEA